MNPLRKKPVGQTDADHAIAVLNRINEADPTVLPALIGFRVPCNIEVADDPTVQVGTLSETSWEVGLLGILNGIFGIRENGFGWIAAESNQDGAISRFKRTDQ